MAQSERITISCPECGERRSLTVRQARRAGKCPYCRFPINIVVNDRYKSFWTDKYSMNEIRYLASTIFDDVPSRQALLASGRVQDPGQTNKNDYYKYKYKEQLWQTLCNTQLWLVLVQVLVKERMILHSPVI